MADNLKIPYDVADFKRVRTGHPVERRLGF